jgi:hypothetical protein
MATAVRELCHLIVMCYLFVKLLLPPYFNIYHTLIFIMVIPFVTHRITVMKINILPLTPITRFTLQIVIYIYFLSKRC